MRRKKILSLVLVLVMIFTLTLPGGMPVFGASDPEQYIFDISEGNITILPDGNMLQVTRGGTILKNNITTSQQITIIGKTTSHKVLIDGVTADIKLAGLDIQLGASQACAFELANGADVTLTLDKDTTSTLRSGSNKAALQVANGQRVTIKGEGALTVTGGFLGAGIGGGDREAGGNISILGGTITAKSIVGAASIGGGFDGSGGNISISGGTVIALGGSDGAGIGGGYSKAGGNISISGGTVTATGGTNMSGGAAGIGGSIYGAGGSISISGGTVTAIGGAAGVTEFDGSGAGIGSGFAGAGGDISISGGTVTAIGGSSTIVGRARGAAGIGRGGVGMGGGVNQAVGSITINSPAIVRAASSGVKPAIEYNNLSAESTAKLLVAHFTTEQPLDSEAKIYLEGDYWGDSLISFKPQSSYNSIAFSIPSSDTYMLKVGHAWQKHSNGKVFYIGETGCTVLNSVEPIDDTEIFLQEKDALTEDLIRGDNESLSRITTSLAVLPSRGTVGSAITWESDHPFVVSHDGQIIVRPAYEEDHAEVILTATLARQTETGMVTEKKEFILTVLAGSEAPNTDKADVEADKVVLTEELIKGANTRLENITKALAVLPISGAKGSVVTWKSSHPLIVSDDGQTVVRPSHSAGDATITLTATLSKGTAKTEKVFNLKVQAQAVPSSGGGSSSSGSAVQPVNSRASTILLGGTDLNAGRISETTENGKKVAAITLDEDKIAFDKNNMQLTLMSSSSSEIQRLQLSGQFIQRMQEKQAEICFETPEARYKFSGDQIDWTEAISQFGENVALKNVKVIVEIEKANEEMVKQAESIAKSKGFTILGPIMEFRILCEYGQNRIEVNKFSSYVERFIIIPEGSRSGRVITGVVLDLDGGVRPMPTQTAWINGRTYVKISSLTNSTYFAASYAASFTDTESHWAGEAVRDMASRMIISGVGGSRFEPDRAITRGEFAAILVRALGLKPEAAASTFIDVKDLDWYCEAIETAVKHNLILGYGNGRFGPKDSITREQAISMTARAMKVTGLKIEAKEEEIEALLAGFGDASKASSYAKSSIALSIKAELINSQEGQMHELKGNITRAEAAVIIRRLLAKSSLIER